MAELKYANILNAFHEFTMQKLQQQFIQTDLGQQNQSIKSIVNKLKMNYQGMSP
jgi:phosphoribosylaminoimidazole-succinocarboxamide synthase